MRARRKGHSRIAVDDNLTSHCQANVRQGNGTSLAALTNVRVRSTGRSQGRFTSARMSGSGRKTSLDLRARRSPRVDLRLDGASSLETFRRPDVLQVVELRKLRHTFWNAHPRLLGRHEDVHLGREAFRVVQRADANELYRGSRAGVVAPKRNPTVRTAHDSLSVSAFRWRQQFPWLASQDCHAVSLYRGIDHVRAAGLTLTPAAVATIDDERRRQH
jgi:hypothetical protein